MRRTQLVLILLTMPFWLGMLMVLWVKNPLFILLPCGAIFLLLLVIGAVFVYATELRTIDDWDLVIRSILHRLGFNVAPPESLMQDIDLEDVEGWHHHHHEHSEHEHQVEKDSE